MAYNRKVDRGTTSTNPFFVQKERQSHQITEQFEEAVVVDVIVNNHHEEYAKDGYNVGAVKFRFINSNYFRPDDTLNWAFSMDANRSDYPLMNEVVYVVKSLNRFYYLRKFNVSNRPTTHGMFGLNEEAQPIPSSADNISTLKQSTANPIKPTKPDGTGLGKYFTDIDLVYRLKHIEGDVIYEGRSGQSIRFGSSWLDGRVNSTARDKVKPWQSLVKNQSPNLLIRIGPDPSAVRTVNTPYGQVIEDINKDMTSVWMVTDQIVPLKYSTEGSGIHRVSVVDFPTQLDGNQIVINTDRFVVNTKTDKIIGTANAGIHWTTLKDFTVDADRNHITWTNQNRADRVVQNWRETIGGTKDISAKQNMIQVAGTNHFISAGTMLSLQGSKIYVGSTGNAREPLVLGATLRDFLSQLIDALTMSPLVLITGRPGGPSQQNPQRVQKFKQLKSQFLSGGNSAPILSLDNFVNRTNEKPRVPRPIVPYKED